jgi:hypothetical protein
MAKGLPRSLGRSAALQSAVKKLTIPLRSVPVVVTSTGIAIGWGTSVISGLPEAHLRVMAVACSMTLSGNGADANLSDTWAGDFGIGTTPANDATITAGDVDLIASTALAAATAEVSPTVVVANGVDLILDNTDGLLEVNLNVLVDAADIVDDQSVTLTADGVVEITVITMLDD